MPLLSVQSARPQGSGDRRANNPKRLVRFHVAIALALLKRKKRRIETRLFPISNQGGGELLVIAFVYSSSPESAPLRGVMVNSSASLRLKTIALSS